MPSDPRTWNDEPIRIVGYDPTWPAKFKQEATLLTDRIGPWITGGIHHVGSTAVPGLAAKPIVDIAVGVADLQSSWECIDILATLDYCYAPYRADEMHWFCKPSPEKREYHLHLVPSGSQRLADEITFRDYLRAFPERAKQYEALKLDLAMRMPNDREAYSDGKSEFVAATTTAAHEWVATKN